MEGEVKRRHGANFCLKNSFLLAFCTVTFTVALLEGIGGVLLWTHYENQLVGMRTRYDSQQSALRDVVEELRGELSKLKEDMTISTDQQDGTCPEHNYCHVNLMNLG